MLRTPGGRRLRCGIDVAGEGTLAGHGAASRAISAAAIINSLVTENGEHGATPIRSMDPGAGPCHFATATGSTSAW
jgi:hypothetical protein